MAFLSPGGNTVLVASFLWLVFDRGETVGDASIRGGGPKNKKQSNFFGLGETVGERQV